MATTAIDKQTNDEAFITELSDSILREDQSTVDNIGKILSVCLVYTFLYINILLIYLY